MKKSGKSQGISKFSKKVALSEILFSIILQVILEKQCFWTYIASNIKKAMFLDIASNLCSETFLFLIFMVSDFSLKIKSANRNICTKFSNRRWMKMAKGCLPKHAKGSGKWSKSGKSQGILKRILSGNPVES